MSETDRTYDVVVWGATGFTGRLVAEYLLQRYGVGDELRWAMAGRSPGKLELVRDELGSAAQQIPLIVADSVDPVSLDKLTASTKVVCSTVGPYAKYGSELVASCVEHGTHYCDLAGEPHWIRQMIDQHHQPAIENAAAIVNSCGFDSIPSDIGVYFLQQQAIERFGEPCQQVKMRVKAMKGGASGGTIASMMGLIEAAKKDRKIAKNLRNPYGLNPQDQMSGPDRPDLQSAAYDEEFEAWIAPFIMAAINTKIVRRSNALLGFPYGSEFRYDEAMLIGRGLSGRLKAFGAAAGLAGFALGSAFDFTRGLLAKRLPKPGQGPSPEQRERGFFNLSFIGKTADGRRIKTKVTGDRDPGYGSTSKMLGESAVVLATDIFGQPTGGVLTPSSAMAEPLLPRLIEHAGLTFELVESD